MNGQLVIGHTVSGSLCKPLSAIWQYEVKLRKKTIRLEAGLAHSDTNKKNYAQRPLTHNST